jgi:glycine/serine hydroxymethyltransferase
LAESDPEIAELIQDEDERQVSGLELIASEVCIHQVLVYVLRSEPDTDNRSVHLT